MRKQTKLVAALSATALLAIGASAVSFAAGWNNSTGEWQYLDNEGNAITDAWRKSGDYWFYLGADGNMAKNEVVQNNDEYYFVNGDGAMVTNQWVSFDEATDDGNDKRWMYFGADGKAYRDKNGDLKLADIRSINGKKYLFDQDGKMLYGWLGEQTELNSNADAWVNADFYYGGFDDGSAQHGWVQLNVEDNGEDATYWFYFDDNGKKVSDKKKTINGATYYFDKTGRMIEEWSSAHKAVSGSFVENPMSGSIVYVNGDGGARKNQWIWAVPSENYISKDYDDDKASWWYADGSGKIVKNKVKKIKGKTYAFDEYGRMVSGLVEYTTANGFVSKANGVSFSEMSGDAFARESFAGEIFFYSDDAMKDGSRKVGYQNVAFDDDIYQMYFNNNGAAPSGYVNKIKKYVSNGIVLKANNDDSNYAGLNPNTYAISYNIAALDNGSYVLINTNGTVQKRKVNIKDSNEIYYATDSDGVIKYAGDKRLYQNGGSGTKYPHSVGVINGTEYFTE